MNNPETLATLGTQDTGQINVREIRRGNQEWTIQKHWQHCTCMNNEYLRVDTLLTVIEQLHDRIIYKEGGLVPYN